MREFLLIVLRGIRNAKAGLNDPRPRARPRRGFTLVELLIVISIIGVLVALLMPAVQAARESARRAKCAHNLKQMAEGCLAHETAHGFLPSGGWGWQWAGDPDRGFGASQPGGWHFNLLPYIDQLDLHDMGKGLTLPGDTPASDGATGQSGMNRRTNNGLIATAPVALFLCPTRHGGLQAFPYLHSPAYCNIPDNPLPGTSLIGKSDYAANAGSNYGVLDLGSCNYGDTVDGVAYPPYAMNYPWFKIDCSLGSNPAWTNSVTVSNKYGSVSGVPGFATGVFCKGSEVTSALIKDGEANTYLIGERYLDPNCYNGQTPGFSCCDNDQGWDEGYDWDTIRGTGDGYVNPTYPGLPPPSGSGSPDMPFQDRKGYSTGNILGSTCSSNFGSAHEAGFNMAFCDGQVRLMNFSIDPTVHMQLGHRSDCQPTDLETAIGAK